MSQGNGATAKHNTIETMCQQRQRVDGNLLGIYPLHRYLQLLNAESKLRCECFIDLSRPILEKSLYKGEKAPYLVYINVLFFQPGLCEDFGNGIDGRDTHMARFDADDGSAHKLGDDVVAFRLCTCTRRQDAQRRAVAHAAGVPSRGRRAAPFREGRLQRGEPLRAHVRPNGVVHGHDGPSELDGEDLLVKDAIC